MELIKNLGIIFSTIGAFGGVTAIIMKWQNRKLDEKLQPIADEIRETKISNDKNYLVDFLDDVEKGVPMSEERIKRGYEVYEEYTEELHQNHYVKDKWKKYMTQSK